MTTAAHAIDWFEIPVRDPDRAQSFYEAMLGMSLRRETVGPNRISVFGHGEQAVGGCLIAGSGHEPGSSGTLVYLGAGPSLDATLARAVAAGGRITTARTDLPGDRGSFAHIVDSEGNRLGLHAAH